MDSGGFFFASAVEIKTLDVENNAISKLIMKGDSVSNSTDGPDIDEERVYRTVLVKSLPPSTSKQNLTIHFQSRKNGGGDIEELRLLDRGSAVITFEEEKGWFVITFIDKR